MFISRCTATDPRVLAACGTGPYGAHKALWNLFSDGPDRQRDFLFRQTSEHAPVQYMVVSARHPRGDIPGWSVETKPYEPRLEAGDRLHFNLRANPVVAHSEEKGGQSKRHDVVMHAKRQLKDKGVPPDEMPPLAETVRTAGLSWLTARAEKKGFAVDEDRLRVDGYLVRSFGKSDGGTIRIATLDFEGLLTVTNPQAFTVMLMEGLGKARAFGCGLMLVRRA